MALDNELISAVNEVCKELGQPESVGKRLIAWLKECSERQLSGAEDNEHLELLRQAIAIGTEADL
jgi:CxC ATPase-based modification system component